ncbi:MAG: flagellin lysine-N-methylase [Lachnospiraceae bacterium]|nr:flagellin lysine-N-methylase [Lachnospiraceae bacterium]
MRYIKPHYYDRFSCVAGQCPDTCCAGWQIVIDEESLEKYGNVRGDFGNRLKNSIDWLEDSFYQYEGRCAFLAEDQLCDLYRELGKDALCETCRMYPRHIEEFEDQREYSLSLSCPEAARIILNCREKVQFLTWETEEEENEEDFEDFDFLMFTWLEDVREVMYRIICNRKIALQVRMDQMLAFARDIQNLIDGERLFEVDELIEQYNGQAKELAGGKVLNGNSEKAGRTVQGRGAVSADCTESDPETNGGENMEAGNRIGCITDGDYEKQYEKMRAQLDVFYRLEHLREEWVDLLEDTKDVLYEKGASAYAAVCQSFDAGFGSMSANREEWECMGEQLLVFFIYTYFCGAVYDDEVYSKAALSVFSVRWIQEFVMYRWVKKAGNISTEDVIELSYRYAREVEHSDLNLDTLEEYLK